MVWGLRFSWCRSWTVYSDSGWHGIKGSTLARVAWMGMGYEERIAKRFPGRCLGA